MKTCSKCKLELQLEQFSKSKNTEDGHRFQCKACDKIYRKENKETMSKYQKKYREENKEMISEQRKKYREENKEKISERNKKYYKENMKERKKYYEKNKEAISERTKKYYKENRNKKNEYMRNKRNMDEGFRISCNLRRRLHDALKGKTKSASTMELVGCSKEFLRDYLEKTKVEGKDYSDAHIDHIRPCASFDLTDPDQQRECFHYTNLQWLPAMENISKGAKWDHETISTDTFLKPFARSEANLCLPSTME